MRPEFMDLLAGLVVGFVNGMLMTATVFIFVPSRTQSSGSSSSSGGP